MRSQVSKAQRAGEVLRLDGPGSPLRKPPLEGSCAECSDRDPAREATAPPVGIRQDGHVRQLARPTAVPASGNYGVVDHHGEDSGRRVAQARLDRIRRRDPIKKVLHSWVADRQLLGAAIDNFGCFAEKQGSGSQDLTRLRPVAEGKAGRRGRRGLVHHEGGRASIRRHDQTGITNRDDAGPTGGSDGYFVCDYYANLAGGEGVGDSRQG